MASKQQRPGRTGLCPPVDGSASRSAAGSPLSGRAADSTATSLALEAPLAVGKACSAHGGLRSQLHGLGARGLDLRAVHFCPVLSCSLEGQVSIGLSLHINDPALEEQNASETAVEPASGRVSTTSVAAFRLCCGPDSARTTRSGARVGRMYRPARNGSLPWPRDYVKRVLFIYLSPKTENSLLHTCHSIWQRLR